VLNYKYHALKTYGGVEVLLFTLALDRVGCELHAPAALILAAKISGKPPDWSLVVPDPILVLWRTEKVTVLPVTEIGVPGRSFKL
jgi:hypothetical protein